MGSPGRVLGLAFGTRRIGLAISDPDAKLAFPAGCLAREGLQNDLAALCALIREHQVRRIVVGLPIHMDGRCGPEAEAARCFARELAEATGLAVEMIDERWTTVEAERALRESPGGRRKRREARDSVAATILLRTFLEREGAAGAAP
jgi:putative Holliday junction resolvase